ncbi:MAG: RtcB family protein, partial [Planctomycetota bacterium]
MGYDINCGVRLVRSNLSYEENVAPRIDDLVGALFRRVPAGVGRSGPYRFDRKTIRPLLERGPRALASFGAVTDRD